MKSSGYVGRGWRVGATLWSAGLVGSVTVALLAAPAAEAQYLWNAPKTGNWSSGGNWIGGTPPVPSATTSLTFNNASGASAYTATNDISDAFSINQLTLDNANATGGAGLITLAGGDGISLTGSNPTINFDGTGDATLTLPVTLNGADLIDGTGSGVLSFGNITGSGASQTSLTINDSAGTFDLNGATTLNATSADSYYGGNFYATNGTVNVTQSGSSLTANNIFDVGDANTGAGSGSSATLNIGAGTLVTENGRFAIGSYTTDTGKVVVNGGGLNIFDGTPDGSGNYYGGRLQLGGSGGNFASGVYGATNATANGATLLVENGGQVSVHNLVEMYTNGLLSLTGTNSVVHVAAIADGTNPTSGGDGTLAINSGAAFYLDGAPTGSITYSGAITGSGGQFYKQNGYTQTLAGTSSYTGSIFDQGGELIVSGSIAGGQTTVDDGSALQISGALGGTSVGVLDGTVEVTSGGSETATNTGVGSDSNGSGTFTIDSGGTVNSATTTVSAGVLNVNGMLSGTTTSVTGGTVTVGSTGTLAATNLNVTGGTVVDSGAITSGTTAVSNAILNVASGATASTSGAVTVGSGGVLSGSGTVGAIVLTAGAVSPGTGASLNGVGDIQTLNAKSLTWTSGATMNFDLNLSAGLSDQLDLSTFFNGASGTPTPTMPYEFIFTTTGTAPGTSVVFGLVSFQAGNTNLAANDFIYNTGGLPNGLSGYFQFNNTGNILDFILNGAAMPEPSALPLALCGLTLVGGGYWRRRSVRAARDR